jgi:two-component system chemotaxis sensor kinase CheA
MIDKFKVTFLEEAGELLTQLEDTLLELESKPSDGELLNKAFRAMHTVKGSSAMFGYDAVTRFTHEVETVLDRCRNGSLAITGDIIGLTLQARDHIRQLLEYETPPADLVEAGDDILVAFHAVDASPPGKTYAAAEAKGQVSGPETAATWRVFFRPSADIFKDGTRVLNLVEELAGLGDATVFPHVEHIPPLADLDPERCYCSWDLLITGSSGENAIRDVFIFVEDRAEIRIERVDSSGLTADEPKKLGQIFVERGLVTAETINAALDGRKKLGEVLLEKAVVSPSEVESALLEQEHLKKVQEKRETLGATIRVASERLDDLVDLVGELVTLQARLSRTALDLGEGSLASISEQFERLIAQLRDNTMSIRMLPIGSTFNKFRRVVRDLSIGLGKEAELVTEGGETELDKTVMEKLGDPLVHIIRNSLDHGIEAPEARLASGKPRGGLIRLSARHSGAYVLIQVSDDGKGLDAEAIRQKAIDKGLIDPSREYAESELFQLVFEPGFSTAKTVTTVSGRGVGMDVVKREIESLGGSVQLDSSRAKGTVVTLKIPLTLAIIDGLLVRIASEFFVMPLSSIDGCIEIGREELAGFGERKIISYRDELLPFVNLRGYFGSGGGEPAISQIVIAEALDAKVGFVVDQVVGDYQTVIKPLGRMFKDVEGVSGATILGDGTVALIIDINRLALVAQREGRGRALSRAPER